ncbi:hypothetical protein BCV72DRAFT_305887 [Rhizopus microsporus var. microsporus]|uniref:Uncharacterized protein n=1 Tax=Rhizopus microsporus var. microsporus TaxID=86635 RepID=A0A1X0R232_RHIZD|nr:hypothetical protein BCV72DRAFT_305887 [Rhizopus microsporus var. microsporus]
MAVLSLLLDDRKDAFSIDDLKKEGSDIEEKEAPPYLFILNALKLYIPKKKERLIIAHQLSFCILANGGLLYAGNNKFYIKLCPQPSASSLHALRVDEPSLYQKLTRVPCALAIFSYDSYLIESVKEARQHKDAVFNSLFDMSVIAMVCKPNGLKFAQNITLFPGIKAALLLGTKVSEGDLGKKKGPASYELTNHLTVKEESKKPKETLGQKIQGLDFFKDIKDLMAKWRNSSLEEKVYLYNSIQQVKDERNQPFLSVQAVRDKLKLKRQRLHFKRVAMKFKPAITHKTATASQSSNTQWHVVQKYDHGIAKLEVCRPSPQTMTSTDQLTLKRFKYKALENTNGCKGEAQKIMSKYSSNESMVKSLLQIPSSMIIKASDADVGSGYYNVRRKLQKAKKIITRPNNTRH